jgi:ABC-2 type transport system permease protein
MRKLWAITRREFVERVRRRWFWISTVVGPLLFGALLLVPLLATGAPGPARIAVLDATTGGLGARAVAALDRAAAFRVVRVVHSPGSDSLISRLGAPDLDGVLVLTDALLGTGSAEFRATTVVAPREVEALTTTLGRVVTAVRLQQAGVDPALLARAGRDVHVTTTRLAGAVGTGGGSAESLALASVLGVVLYTVILMYGVAVKSSVLEEKTTRIVEVLVSSVSPLALLCGKVLGVGAASVLQLAIWASAGRLLLALGAALAGGHAAAGAAAELLDMQHISFATTALFAAYFLGGFLLYAAMFAVAGAVSSNEQDAQQAQQPIVLVLVASVMSTLVLLNDPNSPLSVTLSLVPFSSPIVMPVRWAAGTPPRLEVATSLVLLAAGIVVVAWFAARIYRVGILMTGKRPSVRELVRWIAAA